MYVFINKVGTLLIYFKKEVQFHFTRTLSSVKLIDAISTKLNELSTLSLKYPTLKYTLHLLF